MARGFSVHVGVNKPKPAFQVAELKGCVKDAEAMEKIALACQFEHRKIFRNDEAKFRDVRDEILLAAGELNAGDIFLFTFSGHGSRHTTFNTGEEPDRQDEIILLYDCVLIDNYLRRNLWSQFRKGVRILGVADSCHSGSALFTSLSHTLPQSVASMVTPFVETMTATFKSLTAVGTASVATDPPGKRIFREITRADTRKILETSPEIHKELMDTLLPVKELDATLMTLAACGDGEKAQDAEDNGVFTSALLRVLNENPAPNNYDDLMNRISQKLASENIPQHPVRFPRENPDMNFLGQRPFSISN
jgi:hypothetical protein